MNYAAAWFLVMIGGGQYIGPLPQPACQQAANELHGQGVVCRQAVAMTTCPVPGQPAVNMACPVFDFPYVTVKP
jgi:hypothetical protein